MSNGLTTAKLGKPDYQKALIQHDNYVKALIACGLEVIKLEADPHYPDSTFVEDTALLTPHCAILTNPGASSRKGETIEISTILSKFYDNIEVVKPPGTVEGGDIMMVGSHYFIGLSKRTNQSGAQQVQEILNKNGMTASTITLEKVLHLKTGVSYLEDSVILATGEFLAREEFKTNKIIEVAAEETYAANSLWVNGTVIMPAGCPQTKTAIESAGYETLTVNVSEFRKLDGGISCLSLRF
jgi:dimethylargininase